MCTVNNAGELEKTVCPNLKGVAATISVDRLLDLPFLRFRVVAEESNRRGGDYGYEYGGNLQLTTTLMDWPVCHENIQLWHINCCHTCRKYEDISSNISKLMSRCWIFPRHSMLSHTRDYLENSSTTASMATSWSGFLNFCPAAPNVS